MEQSATIPNQPTQKEKILIIEADVSFGKQIAEAVRKSGYQTTLVHNAKEGIKAIYDTFPSLVIIDVTLPDTDGYTVLEKKQSEPAIAKIPIFLVSNQGVPINMRHVPDGSVAEYLMAIHTNISDIVDKVNRYFNHNVAGVVLPPTDTSQKMKLLWVEDDRLLGSILAKKLLSSGFDLLHVKNGDDALEGLKTFIPDVIVLDLLLPGMSGLDILQKIHSQDKLKKIPVIILSNLSKESDLQRAKLLGAQRFLVKAAVSPDQIVVEIKAVCK